jgi:hypothetical protein
MLRQNPAMIPPVFATESAAARRQQDDEHLKLLAIFHFVVAGFAVLAIGFIVLHYAFMNHIFNNPAAWKNSKSGAPMPPELFKILIFIYFTAGFFLVGFALLNVLSGIFLRQRKHRMLSQD